MPRIVLLTIAVSALVAAGAVAALATPSESHGAAQQATGTQMGNVGMRLQVSKFVKSGHRLIAKGHAVATYRSSTGAPACG